MKRSFKNGNGTFSWRDDFTRVAGAHTLKFGAQVTRARKNRSRCPRASSRCSGVSGTDQNVLEKLPGPPAGATVDVPSETLIETESGSLQDPGIEIL